MTRAFTCLLAAVVLAACVPKHGELPARKTPSLAKADRLYAKGKLEKAEAEYGRVADAGGPEASDARYLRARVRAERGDLAGAEADARAVLAAVPAHWEALVLLGMSQEKRGDRGDAIESFRKAAGIAPRELAPRNNLAFLILQDGRAAEAYDLLVGIVKDHPDSGRAWSNLAKAADALGKADEAAAARREATRIAELEPE